MKVPNKHPVIEPSMVIIAIDFEPIANSTLEPNIPTHIITPKNWIKSKFKNKERNI